MKKILSKIFIIILISINIYSQDHRDWTYNLNIYEVNVRQYTEAGTFAAFENHLERLDEMGVGILWFMPIHPIGIQNRLGNLGSYYSVKDYLDVNPEFGSLDDFNALVDHAHELGMYVIIDWVANHTAWDNQLTITHPDWYTKDIYGNFVPPPGTNWSDVIDLDYSKQELRDYMLNAMKFWIDESKIDGFRCDAASMVPVDFWETCNADLKNYKPDIFLLAEGDDRQYQDIGFDMSYAWGLHGFGSGVLRNIVNGSANANDLKDFIIDEENDYSNQHYRMYFTSNHDENSWHGTVFEQFGDAAEIFAVLTSTLDGMPLIYSGQEAGLNKRLKFFDKDQIIWNEHPFFEIYSTLSHLKKNNKALWNGDLGGEFQRVITSDNDNVFAFIREKDNEKIFVVLNLSATERSPVLFSALGAGHYKDVFTNDTITYKVGSNIFLPAWNYKVYRSKDDNTEIRKEAKLIKEFVLKQNYPNPFNPETTIEYEIFRPAFVNLAIYDFTGREVKTLINRKIDIGSYKVNWDARDNIGKSVSAGIYFYKLSVNKKLVVKKMIFLK